MNPKKPCEKPKFHTKENVVTSAPYHRTHTRNDISHE